VGTVNKELGMLRHILRVAYQGNLLIRLPYIAMAPENNVRKGFLNDAQLDQLRDAAAKVGWDAHHGGAERWSLRLAQR
jgi:hypothetical protein